MVSNRLLPPFGFNWFETHDRLLDWILILLGAMISFLAYTANPGW